MIKKLKLASFLALTAIFTCKGMRIEPKNDTYELRVVNSSTIKYYVRFVDFSKWSTGGIFSHDRKYVLMDQHEIEPGKAMNFRIPRASFPLSVEKRAQKFNIAPKRYVEGAGYLYYSPYKENIDSTKLSNYDSFGFKGIMEYVKLDANQDKESIIIRYKEDDSALMEAISRGDVERVRSLIKQGIIDVNFEMDLSTPLLKAVQFRNAEICSILLDQGARAGTYYYDPATRQEWPDEKNILLFMNKNLHKEESALSIAAQKNLGLICRLMIEKDFRLKSSEIESALNEALNSPKRNNDTIYKILYAIPAQEKKAMKETMYAGLMAINAARGYGESRKLSKDVIKKYISGPLIEDLIHKRMVKVEEMIRAIYPSILRSGDQQLILSLSLDNQESRDTIRENVRKNILGFLFGKTVISSEMDIEKEETLKRKITKDIELVESIRDLRKADTTFYKILGVPYNATAQQIQQAFEERVQPYIRTEIRPSLQHRALQEAYDTLSDPKKREAYDKSLILKQ